jgi:hypothetical protein
MDQLDQFVNEILEAKRLPGVTPEVKGQLVVDLRKQLLDQINRALIEELSDEQIDAFNELIDQPDTTDATTEQFIRDAGVNIETVTAKTLLRFRDLYLRTTKQRDAQQSSSEV